jgi:hypothetical protein
MLQTYKTDAPAHLDAGAMSTEHDQVRFDTKVAVILREGLLPWQELNVTAFLVSGIASEPELLGEHYVDGDDQHYLPMLRQPVLVFQAECGALASMRERAVARELRVAIYTTGLFATGHDAANRASIRSVPSAQLDLAGLAIHGPRNVVDRITKSATLHP